jgi:lysine biosynthesis protein LysW
MPYATCPQCDEEIYFAETPDIGDVVRCPTCDTRLEVVDLNPIELDWPWEAEELDDDDDDELEDGFEVWEGDDEVPGDIDDLDDDDDDDDDLGIDLSSWDNWSDEDFGFSRIKHLDN